MHDKLIMTDTVGSKRKMNYCINEDNVASRGNCATANACFSRIKVHLVNF